MADRPLLSPSPLFSLSPSCILVTDADEEIFDLYSTLTLGQRVQGSSLAAPTSGGVGAKRDRRRSDKEEREGNEGGLGYLDIKKDVLELQVEIGEGPTEVVSRETESISPLPTNKLLLHHSRRNKHGHTKAAAKKQRIVIEASIFQDLGALRNRKGDTGSVVWRASLRFATQTLRQHHFPSSSQTIFNPAAASSASILELGTGTGILPILLQKSHGQVHHFPARSPQSDHGQISAEERGGMFQSWTATDQFENLKLVQRNLKLNGITNVIVSELDWEKLPKQRHHLSGDNDQEVITYDAIISVDCLYNEALINPLVRTLSRYAELGKTLVYVVIELRSSDVIQLFLETWLADDHTETSESERYNWVIHRLPEAYVGTELAVQQGFVVWVGWKVSL